MACPYRLAFTALPLKVSYVPMRLDVSSEGLIDPERHRICHELAEPP